VLLSCASYILLSTSLSPQVPIPIQPVETGITLYALDATTGATLWSSPLGTVKAIANGVVYVVSSTQTLYPLDAATGYTLWQFPLLCNVSALANGVLYGTSANTLCAVDATTGSMLWNYTIANTT
jgi:outer membrane protein assembly factor BamB